ARGFIPLALLSQSSERCLSCICGTSSSSAFPLDKAGPLLQVFFEPGDSLIQSIGLALWLDKEMAFGRVNDQLRGHAQGPERVPEFVGLRRWTFRIALANDDQRRRLHVLNETNGRTLFVNRRIVINRGTEKRNHPLVDQVLAVITLPIREA